MPKATFGVTAATVILLALVGCSAAPAPSSASQGPTVPETTIPETPAPSESTPPPLVAETPSTEDQNEAAFVTRFRELQAGIVTQIPNATDEQVIAAGYEACDRYLAGEDWETMSVIEGEKPNEIGRYLDTTSILSAARLHLCAD